MKNRYVFACLAGLSSMPLAAQAQSPTLTQAQAIQIASTFCQALGAPVTLANGTATFPAAPQCPGLQADHWQPRWSITFPGQASLEVVDATNQVNHYENVQYENQLNNGLEPSGSPIASGAALTDAQAVLTGAGGVTDIASPSSTLNASGTTKTDADTWLVIWNRQVNSIPYKDQQVTVTLQAETGIPILFDLEYPSAPPASTSATVTQSQALTTAGNQLTTAGITQTTLQSATLQVVQPNTYWQNGGSSVPSANAIGVVVWNCRYLATTGNTYEVWVDASSGAVDGGFPYIIAGSAKHPIKAELVHGAKTSHKKKKVH
ncbi:hypothetical protein CCAX7_000120 [Capsulimonas corticalis]|uniref:Uncharacterized protein n=1 Tax=Capsulimonas corticalis TaxID=2219043 RepID=A0A402CRG2_9BACT|nr:hypothetical protein [Capsulimonas corticalis]BDI27961.1 hypothetical protein CCAX7_000120 [Capsulimonas corticalis]